MHSNYPIISKLTAIPDDIVAVADYERLAAAFIPSPVYEYIHSGGGDETTLQANRTAFERIQLYNRVLADVRQGNTRTRLLEQAFRHPILLAPVAHQQLVHSDGELASAEAANAMEAGVVTSSLSSVPLESIARQLQQPKWFQLYFQQQPEQTLELVRRAEAAGYSAIVVTADVPINGLRNRTQRAGFQLPAAAQALHSDPPPQTITLSPDDSVIFQGIMQHAPTWADLQWLRRQTALPILLKGVSHPEDARQAMAIGINGIVVSNHGGRGLDGIPASIELLPALREAVGHEATVLLDSGIRRGTDIFKAIALGADAVMIGRPQIYALAIAGALGVAHMLKLLRDELEITMALTGCGCLADITPDTLYRPQSH